MIQSPYQGVTWEIDVSDWKAEHERRERALQEQRYAEHKAIWDREAAAAERRRSQEQAEQQRKFEQWQRKFACCICGELPSGPTREWKQENGGSINGNGGHYEDNWNRPEGFKLCQCPKCKPPQWTCQNCGAYGTSPQGGSIWQCRRCWGF